MIGLFCFALAVLASPFKSKLRLQAENAVLRHQLIVLRRSLHGRVRFTNQEVANGAGAAKRLSPALQAWKDRQLDCLFDRRSCPSCSRPFAWFVFGLWPMRRHLDRASAG